MEPGLISFCYREVEEWQQSSSPKAIGRLLESRIPSKAICNIRMRIIYNCRHQNEQLGFRIIFTIKDYNNHLIAQEISQSILITSGYTPEQTRVIKEGYDADTSQSALVGDGISQPDVLRDDEGPTKGSYQNIDLSIHDSTPSLTVPSLGSISYGTQNTTENVRKELPKTGNTLIIEDNIVFNNGVSTDSVFKALPHRRVLENEESLPNMAHLERTLTSITQVDDERSWDYATLTDGLGVIEKVANTYCIELASMLKRCTDVQEFNH